MRETKSDNFHTICAIVNPATPPVFILRCFCLLVFVAQLALAAEPPARPTWTSVVTGEDLPVTLLEPSVPPPLPGKPPLIVYLRGLAAPRIGTEADASILSDFQAQGFVVAILDYRGDPRGRWPRLNRDLAALRAQIHHREFLAGRSFDEAQIYLVPAGHRLARGVEFYADGARRLAFDLIYPSQPRHPVGTVLEFSCDNARRMGNYSLQFCTDTLLEGAATEGFAVAMADHPVAAPYRGLDPMPDAAHKVKAAVRTLRAVSLHHGLNGRIVTLGFSRGSGMALLAAATPQRPDLEPGGAHPGVDSSVQGAVVLSGRFTYLDLRPQDEMIPRYVAAWGEPATHAARWRQQGALDQLVRPTVPLFLSINVSESPDALHQMEVLRTRLTQLRSPFEYHPESEPRGHRMPLDALVLDPLLRYLHTQLDAPAPGPAVTSSNAETP